MRLHDEPPQHFETKEIHSSIDSHPVVDEQQIKLWSGSPFTICRRWEMSTKRPSPHQWKPEDLKGELKPRTETYIRLNPKVKKATEEEVTTCIGRAKKQLALFKEIKCFVDNLHETVTTEGIRKRPYPKKPVRDEKPNEQQKRDGITKKRVMEFNNYSPSVLNGLIAKGILETYEVEVAKKEKDLPFQELTPLNEPQLHALEAIKRCLKERPTCLLHGVAGSGKTKLYMHLAKEYIERGQQVLT